MEPETWARLCRTCLATDADLKTVRAGRFVGLLRLLLSKDQYMSESEPCWICHRCEWTVKKIESFVEQCYKADYLLRESLRNGTSPSEISQRLHRLTMTDVLSIDVASDSERLMHPVYSHGPPPPLSIVNIKTEPLDHDPSMRAEPDDPLAAARPVKSEPESSSSGGEEDDYAPIASLARRNAADRDESDATPVSCKAIDKPIRQRRSRYRAKLVPLTLEEQLLEHERRKHDEEYAKAEFKCDICLLVFSHELMLAKHAEKKHTDAGGKHMCFICKRRYMNNESLEYHTREVHAFKLDCDKCGAKFRGRRALHEHLAWHNGKAYKCQICDIEFKKKKTYEKHMEEVHIKSEFKCKCCEEIFHTEDELRMHRLHHSPPSHECEVCGKKFYQSKSLLSHMTSHSGEGRYYCAECNINFKKNYTLKFHLENSRKHTSTKNLEFFCEHCDKKYKTAMLLKRHVNRIHTQRKLLACEFCAASYSSDGALRYHRMTVHQGLKQAFQQVCNVCNKHLSSPSALKIHTRLHTGEKPYECDECQHRFAQKSTLRMHIILVHMKAKVPERQRQRRCFVDPANFLQTTVEHEDEAPAAAPCYPNFSI